MSAREQAMGVLLVSLAGASAIGDHLTTPFDPIFDQVERESGVNGNLLRAIGRRESGFHNSAVSPPNTNGTHDLGIMQINERTGAALGYSRQQLMLEPYANISAAARVLRQMTAQLGTTYTVMRLVASYNQGAGRTLKSGIRNQLYVNAVLTHFFLYSLGRVFHHV